MSPERIDSKRYSKGWRKHLRAGKTAANKKRRDSLTPEQKQRQMTAASWSAVLGLMNLETVNRPELRPTFEKLLNDEDTRLFVKLRYEAAYKDAATGNESDSTYRSQFREEYLLPAFAVNPHIIQQTGPFFRIIDQALFGYTLKKKR